VVSGISSFPLNFAGGLSLSNPAPTATGNTNPDGSPVTSTPTETPNSTSLLQAFTTIANPNLASGQNSGSVLGAYTYDSSFFGSLPTEQSQLLTQIASHAKQQFTDLQSAIQSTYQQKADTITAVTNQWITVKASVNNAQASVTQAGKSIDAVNSALLDMRGLISNSAQDAKYNAQQFDSSLAAINQQADRLGRSLNLVGSINRNDFTPNQVQYRNNLGTGVSTLNGGYIGSDYRIMASDGTVWIPDLNANTLTHYSELQGVPQTVTVTDGTNTVQLPEAASYQNGVKLVSYNATTKAITLQITINPSDPPKTVTGTLQQTGNNLMPSWFYDNLTTDAGRQRAFKAVSEATSRVTLAAGTVQVAANTVATDSKNVDNAMNALNAQNSSAQLTELQQLQDLQTKYTQQVQAMQNNLNQLSSQQQNYIDAFASQISDDPFLSITI